MATLISSIGSCTARIPCSMRKPSGDYNPSADNIQIMTIKVSNGLEFPVVALPGVGHMPAAGEDEQEAARVFYVEATRATQRVVIGVGGAMNLGSNSSSNFVDKALRKLYSVSSKHIVQ